MMLSPREPAPINPQTTWVLKRLELEAPLLLTDASPRFKSVCSPAGYHHARAAPRDAWAIANRTWGVAPVVNEDGTPVRLGHRIQPVRPSSASWSDRTRAARRCSIAEILDLPCHEACDTEVPRFPASSAHPRCDQPHPARRAQRFPDRR